MGVESSTELSRQFQEITNCKNIDSLSHGFPNLLKLPPPPGPKTRVESVIKSYAEGEYDFGIDYQVIINITGYEPEDAKELIRLHSKNESGIVNAITVLISIISLGNSENRNEVGRLEAIFDLMDFSHNSQISLDELTILLLCIGASFSFVLGVSDGEEDAKDPVIIEFAKQIYESLGKKPTSMISKDELVEWTKENVFAHGATNINELYSKLAQIAHVSGEAKEE